MLIYGFEDFTFLYTTCIFLIVSCPCALVISVPLGFFGGIGAASRIGVLVKGSNYLEALSQVRAFVFDKTGTLTKGAFDVLRAIPSDRDVISEEGLVRLAAYAESYSTHPIAVSLQNAYNQPFLPEMVYTMMMSLLIYKPLVRLNLWLKRLEEGVPES